MKLKKYLFLVLIGGLLLSCSSTKENLSPKGEVLYKWEAKRKNIIDTDYNDALRKAVVKLLAKKKKGKYLS